MEPSFEWDERKNQENQAKHGVSFEEAQHAFLDPDRLIVRDKTHSTPTEERLYCIGKIIVSRDEEEFDAVVTVRFTYRGETIRIFGAGFWRKERALYHEQKRSYLYR